MTEAAGKNQKVNITSDITLDFTGLFTPGKATESPVSPLTDKGQYKPLTEPQKPAERQIEGIQGQQAAQLYLQAKREENEKEKLRQIYSACQQKIERAAGLREDILKGLKTGQDLEEILLSALECISLMTGDATFSRQGKADLVAVYGWGLGQQKSTALDLEEARGRLAKLKRPELTAEEVPQEIQRQIRKAVKRHEELISKLEEELLQTS